MNSALETDTSGTSELFWASRNIHPSAINVTVLLDDDVAQVDPDADLKGLGRAPGGFGGEIF